MQTITNESGVSAYIFDDSTAIEVTLSSDEGESTTQSKVHTTQQIGASARQCEDLLQ